MGIGWGEFSAKSRTALKTGWLISAGVIALYLGVTQPRDQARGIVSEKASGLAAVSGGLGWEPISLWRQTSILPHLRSEAYLQKGIVGGVSVNRAVVAPASLTTFSGEPGGGEEGTSEDRKLARTNSLGLIVKTRLKPPRKSFRSRKVQEDTVSLRFGGAPGNDVPVADGARCFHKSQNEVVYCSKLRSHGRPPSAVSHGVIFRARGRNQVLHE